MLEPANRYKDKDVEAKMKNGKKKDTFQMAGKEKITTSTVVFVPPTIGGKLVEMQTEKEEELASITKLRVKYHKAGGTQLGLLFSTDLAAGGACGRQDFQPCMSRDERRPYCKSQSILYESKYTVCIPGGKKTPKTQKLPRTGIYYGESSRSLYELSREHLKDGKDFSSGSHIIKHWLNKHARRVPSIHLQHREQVQGLPVQASGGGHHHQLHEGQVAELQERVHGQLPDQDLRGGEQARQEEEGERRGDGRGRGKAETVGLQNETSEAKKNQS